MGRFERNCVNKPVYKKLVVSIVLLVLIGNGEIFSLTSQLMLYREIIAVCSQIHTQHINTLCGQNVELLDVKLAVHIVATGL